MIAEKLNLWLTLGANIGVLLGIFLLVFQISQTNTMMEATIRQEFGTGSVDLISEYVQHPRVLLKMNSSTPPEWESPEERIVGEWLVMGIFRAWEKEAWMHAHGLMPTSEWTPLIEDMKVRSTSPFFVEQWHLMRPRHNVYLKETLDPMFGTGE